MRYIYQLQGGVAFSVSYLRQLYERLTAPATTTFQKEIENAKYWQNIHTKGVGVASFLGTAYLGSSLNSISFIPKVITKFASLGTALTGIVYTYNTGQFYQTTIDSLTQAQKQTDKPGKYFATAEIESNLGSFENVAILTDGTFEVPAGCNPMRISNLFTLEAIITQEANGSYRVLGDQIKESTSQLMYEQIEVNGIRVSTDKIFEDRPINYSVADIYSYMESKYGEDFKKALDLVDSGINKADYVQKNLPSRWSPKWWWSSNLEIRQELEKEFDNLHKITEEYNKLLTTFNFPESGFTNSNSFDDSESIASDDSGYYSEESIASTDSDSDVDLSGSDSD